jgi:plastocyanin
MRPTISIALALAIGAIVLAGCGSSSNSTTSGSAPASETTAASTATSTKPAGAAASSKVALAANPEGQLKYDKSSLTAKAGSVSIAFTNSSPVEHDVTIESSGGQSEGATPVFQGGTKILAVSLKPGTYKFFCSVPGHRQAGMEGTLVVN